MWERKGKLGNIWSKSLYILLGARRGTLRQCASRGAGGGSATVTPHRAGVTSVTGSMAHCTARHTAASNMLFCREIRFIKTRTPWRRAARSLMAEERGKK